MSTMSETAGRSSSWSVGSAFRAVATVVATWHERARQRTHFASLTERELADIGLTRYDQWRECGKPFWRD